ncbi:MAG: hypothetical protein UHX00_06885 [Caryophanon sp.]|nr:hypothetical protein [Caryophanon sp.]
MTEEITETPSSPDTDEEESTEEITETPSSPDTDEEESTEEITESPSSPNTDEDESTEENTESPSSPETDEEESTEENTESPSVPDDIVTGLENGFVTAGESTLTTTEDGATYLQVTTGDNATASYRVENESIQALFAAYGDHIADVAFEVTDSAVSAIDNVTLSVDEIDGDLLEGTGIQALTLNGTTSINNVQNLDSLTVNTSGTVTFSNTDVTAATVAGDIDEIIGASGETLTVQSSSNNVVFSDVTSTNIVIGEAPAPQTVARQVSRNVFASTSRSILAASAVESTSTFAVTFDDPNAGQTLTISRENTTVDIQKGQFGKIAITENGADVRATQELLSIAISNNVTHLTLRQNVTTLALAPSEKTIIAGSGTTPIKIGTLNVDAPNKIDLVELVNATYSTFAGSTGTVENDVVVNSAPAVGRFTAALEFKSLGRYKINTDIATGDTFKILTVGKDVDPSLYNGTVPSNATPYTPGTLFTLYSDVEKIILYKTNGTTTTIAEIDAPQAANVRISGMDSYDEILTYTTRFKDNVTPAQGLKYLYVFKNGALFHKNNNITGNWTKNADGLNTYAFSLPVNLTDEREVYIVDGLLTSNGAPIATYPNDYVAILKAMADEAKRLNNPEMIKPVLERIYANHAGSFDSFFLSKYVADLTANPGSYNTIDQVSELVEQIQEDNAYDKNQTYQPKDLYLTGVFNANGFSYSNAGIVQNTISDTGELLFIPKAIGETTVRITNTAGEATLVNVSVDASLTITDFEIVGQDIGTLTMNDLILEQQGTFRTALNAAGAMVLLPTTLSDAVVFLNGTQSKVAISSLQGTQYNFVINDVTLKDLTLQDLGLASAVTGFSANKVGVLTTANGIALYPKANGSEMILVSDGTHTVAVNTVFTENGFTKAEPVSKALTLNELSLTNVDTIKKTSTSGKSHVVKVTDGVQIFANSEETDSYIITSSNGNKTIVNSTVATPADGLAVTQFEVLAKTLQNTGVSIVNVAGDSIRYDGMKLLAVGEGKSTVTLSDGKQYEVTISKSGNTYSMTEPQEVKNFTIAATDVDMTNITSATSSNPADTVYISNNRVVVNKPTAGDSTITLISNTEPTERTIVYVTKADNGDYTYAVAKNEFAITGFETIKEVIGSISPYVRPVVKGNKVTLYSYEKGTRLFRVTDANGKSVALNVEVKETGGKLAATAAEVTHTLELPSDFKPKDANFSTTAAFIKDESIQTSEKYTLYATGLGLIGDKATIEIPLKNQSAELTYVIELTKDADTNLLKFAEPTITYNESITAESLGLTTLTQVNGTNEDLQATISNGQVHLAISDDTTARLEIVGTEGLNTAVKTYVYVTRTGETVTTTIEKLATPINLTTYGFTKTPAVVWDLQNIGRAVASPDLTKFDVYSLSAGKTTATLLEDGQPMLLVNVENSTTDPRTVTATVVEKKVTDVVADKTATEVLSGNAVRLSADGASVYAVAIGEANVRLSDGSIAKYTVSKDATTGQYAIAGTVLANTTTITNTDLSLTGNLQATSANTNIATVAENGEEIIVYGIAAGTTTVTVTDAAGKKVALNVTVDATDKKVTYGIADATLAITDAQLIHTEDAAKVRIDGTTVYALSPGTVRFLAKDTTGKEGIYEIVVSENATTKHLEITAPTLVSEAIFTNADFGFAANAAISIETGYDDAKFFVGEVNDKTIAYSKLTGTTTGSTDFVVKTTDGLRTLVHLVDSGAGKLAHHIAVDNITAPITNISNAAIARLDDANVKLYGLQAGYTTAKDANGYLYNVHVEKGTARFESKVEQVSLTATATAINTTDTAIIAITADKIYAKAVGKTQVLIDGIVNDITVAQDANGKLTIVKKAISSKTVLATDAQLTKITDAEIVAGNTNALKFTFASDNLVISVNEGAVAQTVAVKITDGTHHAIVNVTIDANGAISAAKVAKHELTVITAATETKQTANGRAVWGVGEDDNGNTINIVTIYPFIEGKTFFKFTNGYINTTFAKTSNAYSVTDAKEVVVEFTGTLNNVSNGAMLYDTGAGKLYAKNTGTAIIRNDASVYIVNAVEADNQINMTISAALPFKELVITAGTYTEAASTLVNTKAVVDEDETTKLIIYAEGTGTSEIALVDGGKTTIHQAKAIATAVTTKEAKKALEADFEDATLFEGESVRVDANNLYFLKEGASTLTKDDKLIDVFVTRDADGFFTATPAFVSKTLTEEAPNTVQSFVVDDKVLYATSNLDEETFYTANYRVTAQTKKENGRYTVTADERQMKTYASADFGLSGNITLKSNASTDVSVANMEAKDGNIYIYAGTKTGSTVLTVTDGTTDASFTVTRDDNGNITVTPQADLTGLEFSTVGLATDGTVTVSTKANYTHDTSIVKVVTKNDRITFNPIKEGVTSLALQQDGDIKALINVFVQKDASGNFTVRATPVTYTAASTTALASTFTTAARIDGDKSYATSVGQALISKDATTAQFVKVEKSANGTFSLTESEHAYKAIAKAELALDNISSANVTGSSVATMKTTDTVYIYQTGDGTADVLITDSANKSALVVAQANTTLTTTIAKTALTNVPAGLTWTSDLVQIRGEEIYATASGKTVAKGAATGYNVLVNIGVTRDGNNTVVITEEVVRHDFTQVATVLDGDAVKADGNIIYALQAGTATVKLADGKIHTVTVTKLADGHFDMEVSDAVTYETIKAADVGVDAISTYDVEAITGSGVVDVALQGGELLLYAKQPGQAEVQITDATGKIVSIVHVQVTGTQSGLSIVKTVAKKANVTGSAITAVGTNDFLRVNDKDLYATKEGSIVTQIDGELYSINAVRASNKLTLTTARIEKTFNAEVTLTTSNGVLKVDTADTKKIIALKTGTEDITVDGKKYRITVGEDGSITQTELLNGEIDVDGLLTSITSTSLTVSSIVKDVTVAPASTKLSLEAVKEGSETITISDGTTSIQAKITVAKDSNGALAVTAEIVKQTISSTALQRYANGINTENTATYTSAQGIIKVVNGGVEVYPGAAGEQHVIIKSIDGDALYVLNVAADLSYTFSKFTQTISFDTFGSYTTVFEKQGTAQAQISSIGANGLDVTFSDFSKTTFLLKGTNVYKAVTVKAKSENNQFVAEAVQVQNPLVYANQEVQVLSGAPRKVVDGTNTILYGTEQSANGAIIVKDSNGQSTIYKTAVDATTYGLTATTSTEAYTATSLTHLTGTDVVRLSTNELVAQQIGTGTYHSNDGNYIEITVAADGKITKTELDAITLDNTKVQSINQLALTNDNVHIDGLTLYGKTTEAVAAEVTLTNGAKTMVTVYNGLTTATIQQASIKTLLGWNAYAKHSLQNATTPSKVVNIVDDNIYILGAGTETITFTSANGLSRTVTIAVDEKMNATFTPSIENELLYHVTTPDDTINSVIRLTFSPAITTDSSFILIGDADNNSDIFLSRQGVTLPISNGLGLTGTFKLTFGELTGTQTYTVQITSKGLVPYHEIKVVSGSNDPGTPLKLTKQQ